MATLTVPETIQTIPESTSEVDLYLILQQDRYFCPNLGGVVRSVKWLADNLESSGISFRPSELSDALTRLIKSAFIQVSLATDITGDWYTAFTAVSRPKFQPA